MKFQTKIKPIETRTIREHVIDLKGFSVTHSSLDMEVVSLYEEEYLLRNTAPVEEFKSIVVECVFIDQQEKENLRDKDIIEKLKNIFYSMSKEDVVLAVIIRGEQPGGYCILPVLHVIVQSKYINEEEVLSKAKEAIEKV